MQSIMGQWRLHSIKYLYMHQWLVRAIVCIYTVTYVFKIALVQHVPNQFARIHIKMALHAPHQIPAHVHPNGKSETLR